MTKLYTEMTVKELWARYHEYKEGAEAVKDDRQRKHDFNDRLMNVRLALRSRGEEVDPYAL